MKDEIARSCWIVGALVFVDSARRSQPPLNALFPLQRRMEVHYVLRTRARHATSHTLVTSYGAVSGTVHVSSVNAEEAYHLPFTTLAVASF